MAEGGTEGAQFFLGSKTDPGAPVLSYLLCCQPGSTVDTLVVVPAPGTGQVLYAEGPRSDLTAVGAGQDSLDGVVLVDRDRRAHGDRLQLLDVDGDLDDPMFDGDQRPAVRAHVLLLRPGSPIVARMAVHLTRIYTRTGDDGTTALGDMSRVRKTDPRLTAYADVDEANCSLGVVLALGNPEPEVAAVLRLVQNELFDVGADLCTPVAPDPEYPPLRVTPAYTTRLETACDTFNARLQKLSSFILPGGTPAAALLHVSRTVVRRAERATWELIEAEPERTSTEPALYLNRLSDLLFILSRVANPGGDVLWKPGGER